MSNYMIERLKNSVSSGNIKNVLKKLQVILESDSLSNQIIIINNRFNKIESDNRMGLLSYDDYLMNTARISNSILSIISEIENNVELLAQLRRNEKHAFYARYVKITVDFSGYYHGKKKEYRGNQFLDIDDFLNEIYFEINDFVPPGSFRKKWTLKKKNINIGTSTDIDDGEISHLLNRIYPLIERTYMEEEFKSIQAQNDINLSVLKL